MKPRMNTDGHGCGVEIVQSLIAQFNDHRIFYAARRELVANRIVAAVPRQFTVKERIL